MKKMTILGIGKSGLAAAKLAKKKGYDVFISDYAHFDISNPAILELEKLNIPYEVSGHSDKIYDADIMVLSPGIKKELPVVKKFYDKNIPVISEIEMAFRFSENKFTAITGSNGKTTTCTLLGQMYEKEFLGQRTAGNIGIPLSDVVGQDDLPISLELSSFQIETLDRFKADTALFLNLSPNHLDWYDNYDAYVAAKIRLIKNMDEANLIIFNLDDERLKLELEKSKCRSQHFSLFQKCDAYLDGDTIVFHKTDYNIDVKKLKIKGPHLIYNYMASTLAAIENNVSPEIVHEVIYSFNGLEHRMEFVGSYLDIHFYNDSKSTSIAALSMALQSYDQKIILICGGKHKGASYDSLQKLIKEKTKKVYVFGEAATLMQESWNGFGTIIKKETLFDSLDDIKKHDLNEENTVLFSPACSSFDQFKNYEIRGEQFKNYIHENFG